MARRCKCHVTGEEGTTDTFFKVGRYYYKSPEIYEEERLKKEEWQRRKQLAAYFSREFLHYGKGQPPPPLLYKKLNELAYYTADVIQRTMNHYRTEILYYLSHKSFQEDNGRINYSFAIIKAHIAEIAEQEHREKMMNHRDADLEIEAMSDCRRGNPVRAKAKDISRFLD